MKAELAETNNVLGLHTKDNYLQSKKSNRLRSGDLEGRFKSFI